MLLVPGMVAVYNHGVTKVDKTNWQSVLFKYLVYSLLIIFVNCAVMFLSYPRRTMSFSPWVGADSNTMAVGFIFKYLLVALACSVGLPKGWFRWKNRKKGTKPKIGDDE
jgi:hypothetical protein